MRCINLIHPDPGLTPMDQALYENLYRDHHSLNPDEKILLQLHAGARINHLDQWCKCPWKAKTNVDPSG